MQTIILFPTASIHLSWWFFTCSSYPRGLRTLSKRTRTLAGPEDPGPQPGTCHPLADTSSRPTPSPGDSGWPDPVKPVFSLPRLPHQKPVDEWCPGWQPVPKAALSTWIWVAQRFSPAGSPTECTVVLPTQGMGENHLIRNTETVYSFQQFCPLRIQLWNWPKISAKKQLKETHGCSMTLHFPLQNCVSQVDRLFSTDLTMNNFSLWPEIESVLRRWFFVTDSINKNVFEQ